MREGIRREEATGSTAPGATDSLTLLARNAWESIRRPLNNLIAPKRDERRRKMTNCGGGGRDRRRGKTGTRALFLLTCVLLELPILPVANALMDDKPVAKARMDDKDKEVDVSEVRNWALRFGRTILQLSSQVTCLRTIKDNFNNSGAEVEWVDGTQMLDEMRSDVQHMVEWKRQAVKRIIDVAEHAAKTHIKETELKHHDYVNVKYIYDPDEDPPEGEEWKPVKMSLHRNFDDIPVSTQSSAIHVPTNVYGAAPDILNAIKWSDYLNPTFRNNMAVDPSLSWQFFGSGTGFLRLFPTAKWRTGEDPDLFDCRMRPWFIQAAASAKDIVILVDGSGSMTGLRKAIARDVVMNILDTLTDNDFVTVLRFSDIIQPVVKCFENVLVQANERNIQEFKDSLDDFETTNIANFTLGLITAFELLQKYHKNSLGSQCNQAIMLVTDGAPYTYEEIFEKYNWPNIPVRVFTYLIGREVTDNQEVNWMACANRGYYTHVANLAEVREQVQKYIPVMSRPIVLTGQNPFIWTPVYADIADVRLTDWIWQARERVRIGNVLRERSKRQLELMLENGLNGRGEDQDSEEESENGGGDAETSPAPQNQNESMPTAQKLIQTEAAAEMEFGRRQTRKKLNNDMAPSKYAHLMTTVAMPVFDRKNNSMPGKEGKRNANLLGVAGTDVPIREILKMTPSYKLGVNGYSFAITNNGYILFHPDLRPLYQDMLKPGYGSVDLNEVELVDNKLGPREIDESLRLMRVNMIDRKIGWNKLAVKIHLDSMRRVVTRNNSYYYGPIEGTPFTLAIVLPDPYGHYRVQGRKEVKRKEEDWTKYFRGDNWRVHPDWVYCDVLPKENEKKQSPEDIIRHFLNEALGTQNFRWKTSSIRPPILDKPVCERELVQSLVFDAVATYVEDKSCVDQKELNDKVDPLTLLLALIPRDHIVKTYGIMTTFVATRSGLLRFEDHRTEEEKANSTEKPFHEIHTRATDELFYRRAVDFYQTNRSSFVFSVPFDAGTRNNSLVTASHAIFLGSAKQQAPAAVVGLQFMHSAFADAFFNSTAKCMQNCNYKCSDEELDCYLLDNNGFVIVSEQHAHTGKFFGEIDYSLFNAMIEYKIYRQIKLYDYQAICLEIVNPSGPASVMSNPLNVIANSLSWIWKKLAVLMLKYSVFSLWSKDVEGSDSNYEYEYPSEEDRIQLNKSKPRPCDKEFDLYEMQPGISDEPVTGHLYMCHTSGCDKQFIVQQVPYTNLVMLVAYTICPCESTSENLEPKEVIYNESVRCARMKSNIYRDRPSNCVSKHPEEGDIGECSNRSFKQASIYTMTWASALLASFVIRSLILK